MFKKLLKNERGLTLVELLAVIVILGIISAVAVPSIGGIIEKSKEDAIKADAITIINAAKLYSLEKEIDSNTGVTPDELEEQDYLDSLTTTWDNNPKVIKTSEGEFLLSGTGSKAGKSLTFSNASISDIDADVSGDDDTTIGQ